MSQYFRENPFRMGQLDTLRSVNKNLFVFLALFIRKRKKKVAFVAFGHSDTKK